MSEFGYRVSLATPTHAVHVAVRNRGGAVADRDGVFTFRLWDAEGVLLSNALCELPVSPRLGRCYRYAPAAEAGSLIPLGRISASRPFVELEVEYVGIFTDTPLSASQLGPMLYVSEAAATSSNRAVTGLVRPTATSQNGGR